MRVREARISRTHPYHLGETNLRERKHREMASIDDLAARVAALEERMGMESGLRASADRDLSEVTAALRAQQNLIQALAMDHIEDRGTLRQHTRDLHEIRASLAEHGTLMRGMAAMLQTLIDREG